MLIKEVVWAFKTIFSYFFKEMNFLPKTGTLRQASKTINYVT